MLVYVEEGKHRDKLRDEVVRKIFEVTFRLLVMMNCSS